MAKRRTRREAKNRDQDSQPQRSDEQRSAAVASSPDSGEGSTSEGHTPGRAGTGEGERGTQTDRAVQAREAGESTAPTRSEQDGEHGTSQRLVRGENGEIDDFDPDTSL